MTTETIQDFIKNMTSGELSGALKLESLKTQDPATRCLLLRAATLLGLMTGAEYSVTVAASNATRGAQHKIPAIKFVRQQIAGMSLKAAKEAVEAGAVTVFRGVESEARQFAEDSSAAYPNITFEVGPIGA